MNAIKLSLADIPDEHVWKRYQGQMFEIWQMLGSNRDDEIPDRPASYVFSEAKEPGEKGERAQDQFPDGADVSPDGMFRQDGVDRAVRSIFEWAGRIENMSDKLNVVDQVFQTLEATSGVS